MAATEGRDKDTKLLANQIPVVPNFNVPYEIEENLNITKIPLFKRQCCNKITASFIIILFLTILYAAAGVLSVVITGGTGGYILLGIFLFLALPMLFYLMRLLSLLFQYPRTEIYLNKQENIIQIYEAKIRNIYGNLNNVNCGRTCGCDLNPRITTICRLTDIIDVQMDNKELSTRTCCASRKIPVNQVKLTFIDMYSGNQNQFFIQQSGKYADFTACQYLNYIIQQKKK
eukprot:763861_1